ncbi:MAG: restriction endonuclease subunit S [Sphingobacteriales bacterium]|nr:MAG: restriction endonuclease subunit S [Sphingobacteriales bacterium]
MSFERVKFTELLSAIVDNRGRTCPVGSFGRPLIATNCISNLSLYPSYDSTRFVSEETYRTWFRGHPIPGDILFVCKGSPGRTNWVPDPVDFCIAQDMVAVRANPAKIYPKYPFAALRSESAQAQISNLHVGTMIPHFKKGDFSKLLIPLPEVSAQSAIGDLYFEMSERINLLRETNATLEAIAQALFKSWFVDFDPVRAKMAGRAPEGMDEATAALFPDALEETALGLVPKGWPLRPFLDAVDVIGGGTPKTSNPAFWGGEIPWFSVVDAPDGSDTFVVDTEKHITEAGLKGSSTKLLPQGTTIISARGTVGKLALAGRPMAMNQSCYGLSGKGGDSYFTYFSAYRLVEALKARSHGSVFDTITRDTLASVHSLLPGKKDVIRAFEDAVTPVMNRVLLNLYQSRGLADLRDTLLPRLISGQLRLPHAQAQLEPHLS